MSSPIEKLNEFKNSANNFIHANRTLNDFNLKKKTKFLSSKCRNLIENYENLTEKNLNNYNNLKDNSSEFFKNYFDYLKIVEKKLKKYRDRNFVSPFYPLIRTYKNMGYKIPDLSIKHNLFNNSLLLEENAKIKNYFKTKKFGEKEEKQYEYFKKVEFFVNIFDEDFQTKNKIKNNNLDNNIFDDETEKKKLHVNDIVYIKPVFNFINQIKKEMNKKNKNNPKKIKLLNQNKNQSIKIFDYNEKKLIENRTKNNNVKNRNISKLKEDLLSNSKNFSTNFTERNSLPMIKNNIKKKVKFISQEDSTNCTNNNTINASFPLNKQKGLLKKSTNDNNKININLNKKPSIWDENEEMKKYNRSLEDTISSFEIEKLYNLMKLSKQNKVFPRTTHGKKTFLISNKKSLDKKDSNKNIRLKLKRENSHRINKKNNISFDVDNVNDSFISENKSGMKSTRNKIASNYFNYKKNLQMQREKKNLIEKRKTLYETLDLKKIFNENNISSFDNNNNSINSIKEKEKNMKIENGEINDFLKVILKTKKKIFNCDGLYRLFNNKIIKGGEKSKLALDKIKKLDKKILNLDKDLIYVVEQIKKND